MTLPLVLHFGSHTILFHMVMDIFSVIVGGLLYHIASRNDGINSDKRLGLLIGAAVGALIGSRLLGALENPFLFLHPPALLYYYASKTIIGGIAGGIIGIETAKFFVGYRRSTGDTMMVPLLLATLIGRIGCLFTGVIDGTVGNPCNYALCFNQGDGIPRHPTSLYEIIFLLTVLIVYLALKKKFLRLGSGVVFRTFIILYFMFRFFIEFLKPLHPIFIGFSAIQIVCVLFSIWYAFDIYRIQRFNATAPSPKTT